MSLPITLTNATTGQKIAKVGQGFLHGVVLNKTLAAALKLYDAVDGSDTNNLIATIASGAVVGASFRYYGTLTKGLVIYPGDAVQASTTLTSDATEVSDGDTVTIDTVTYRFKNTPSQAYDVKRSGTADTTLGNLIKAINASGLGDGSDYYAGTLVHPSVTAGTSITSHHFTITARNFGTAGNSIATTKSAAHLSFTGSTLASGANGTAYDVTVSVE